MQVAQQLGVQVPRRLRQEPLHRPHLHHAGAGAAREVGAPQAERDRPGVPRQERAAGRRLDRARHDLRADHRDGARGRRAARSTSPRPRRRCAIPNVYGIDMPADERAGRRTAAPIEEVAKLIGADWLIYQDLEDLIAAVRARRPEHRRTSTPRASPATTSPATSRRNTSTRLQLERSDEAKATAQAAHRGSLKAIRAV